MALRESSSLMRLKHRGKGPFRLTTPSTTSNPPTRYVSPDSPTSLSSSPQSRSPSVASSSETSTTSDESSTPFPAQETPVVEPIVDDTDADALAEQPGPSSITEGLRLSRTQPNYFPADHFLAPPTPEQLRRRKKRKPRHLLWTFVRQRQREQPKKEIFVDERVKKRVKVDKSNWQTLESVTISPRPVDRASYILNTAEFQPVKVLRRVYKPTTLRRRRNHHDMEEGIGIGGYVVRFKDGHEHCFAIDQLNAFIKRYPGLEELIEEFEHLALAREDDDRPAIAYFKRQRMLREEGAASQDTMA